MKQQQNPTRFVKWKDNKSGVHPFLPISMLGECGNSSCESVLTKGIFGLLFVLFRIPALFCCSCWFITAYLTANLSRRFIPFIGNWVSSSIIETLFIGLFSRMILLCCGFWQTSISFERTGIAAAQQSTRSSKPEIIISNHQSYIDIFVYLSLFSSVSFAFPVGSEGLLVELTPLQALKQVILSNQLHSPHRKQETLSQVIKNVNKKHKKALIIFIEGATTNGLAILQPQPIFKDKQLTLPSILVCGIKYTSYSSKFSVSFPIGNFFIHFLNLLTQPANKIHIRSCRLLIQITTTESSSNISMVNNNDEEMEMEMEKRISNALSRMAHLTIVKLTSLDKEEFISYWNNNPSIHPKRFQ